MVVCKSQEENGGAEGVNVDGHGVKRTGGKLWRHKQSRRQKIRGSGVRGDDVEEGRGVEGDLLW